MHIMHLCNATGNDEGIHSVVRWLATGVICEVQTSAVNGTHDGTQMGIMIKRIECAVGVKS